MQINLFGAESIVMDTGRHSVAKGGHAFVLLTVRRSHSVSVGGSSWGRLPPVRVPARCCGGLRTLLDGKAERFGMGPPVVLGQRLAEGAGPVGHGPAGRSHSHDRKLGDGNRETA